MQNYFLKTKFNEQKTAQLQEAIDSVGLDVTVINEAFEPDNDQLRNLGVQKIPCVIAVDSNRIINQTDNAYALVTFNADSQAILDALNQE